VNYFLLQNKIVTDKINEDIQQSITPSTGQVAEGFFIHECPERRIKKINGIDDQILQNEGAKVILSLEFAPVRDMPLGKGCSCGFVDGQHLGIEIAYPRQFQFIVLAWRLGVFFQFDEQGRLQAELLVFLFRAHDHGTHAFIFNNMLIP
jgi:hypothetical protein